jgi:hypothetical protein
VKTATAIQVGEPKRASDLRAQPEHGAEPRLSSRVDAASWGLLPGLALTGAMGLLLIALADTGARFQSAWAEPLFWTGLLVVFMPIAARVASPDIGRGERIALVVALGFNLHLVKVLHSPAGFTHHDEFIHLRTLQDIVISGRLFLVNPLLPPSSVFPGLEIVTAALASLTGLPFFYAGVVVIGASRIILMLALYLFFEQVGRSAQAAAMATTVYMTNANFVFFDSMFKYETLALSFAAMVLLVLALRGQLYGPTRPVLTGVGILAIGAVVVTHHLTTYALVAFVGMCSVAVYACAPGRRPGRLGLNGMALLALVAAVGWLVYVATLVVGYLSGPVGGAVAEMVHLIAREPTAGREIFRSSAGQLAPLWERLIGFASVALVLSVLPFGLLRIWHAHRANGFAWALAAGSLGYPLALAFRFTSRGWEAANRSSEFLFVAVGFVVAVAAAEIWPARLKGWLGSLAFAGCASIVFLGGVIAGWPPEWRLPGPYRVLSDTRSIEPQGLAAAAWARSYLGVDNGVAADRTNRLLMGSHGAQWAATSLSGGMDSEWILYAPRLYEDLLASMRQAHIEYVVVDLRLRQAPNAARAFYPNTDVSKALEKFDDLDIASRIFDSGDIQIYSLGNPSGGR